jgi:hypothetical protein
MRAAAHGLAQFHCKYHVQHKSRHGSHWRKSYRAGELRLYRKAADAWIKANRSDIYVTHALSGLEGLLQAAGEVPNAASLRGMPPRDRARIAIARMRAKGVPADRLLSIYLAVAILIEEDPTSHRSDEFLIVQLAKAAHRLASGYHRRWETGFELHTYQRSSGRVLRYLGRSIQAEAESIIYHHLPALIAFKIERYGAHPAATNPELARSSFAQPRDPSRPKQTSGRRVREEIINIGGIRVVRRIISDG